MLNKIAGLLFEKISILSLLSLSLFITIVMPWLMSLSFPGMK
jgi:hypothetical protein